MARDSKPVATTIHKLTDRQCKAAAKKGSLGDGGNLFLRVSSATSKSWSFRWKRSGNVRELGLGGYPAVSLAKARELASKMREARAANIDPASVLGDETEPTFSEAAEQFITGVENRWRNEKHRAQWRSTLETYAKPISRMPVSQIGIDDVLRCVRPIWETKAETATRVRGRIERILSYTTVKGWRSGPNPAIWRGNLDQILPPAQKLARGHHPALAYEEAPKLWGLLVDATERSARALQLCLLTVTRTKEVIGARWPEIDTDAAVWTIPAERMKGGIEHRVPLTKPALAVLEGLQATAGGSPFIFPGRDRHKMASQQYMTMRLRRLNLGKATVHGLRTTFRTWADDKTEHPRDLVERCLAHVVGSATERAYRRSDALDRRRVILEEWADYLTISRGQVSG